MQLIGQKIIIFKPMNRIDRLFGILVLLQTRKYINAEKIADQFGISIRTVYRDMKALGEQGIPLSFEQHKGYGTKIHQAAIKEHGLSPLHRTSFNLTKFL